MVSDWTDKGFFFFVGFSYGLKNWVRVSFQLGFVKWILRLGFDCSRVFVRRFGFILVGFCWKDSG